MRKYGEGEHKRVPSKTGRGEQTGPGPVGKKEQNSNSREDYCVKE